MTAATGKPFAALPGSQFPLGATPGEGGTNFAVSSGVADRIVLCLVDDGGAETQIPLLDYDAGVWHAFVPGIGTGQAYGYRATGPYDPARGVRCNPAKLLMDPYAHAFSGSVTFGPELSTDLGVTAVELLSVHESVPEAFLLRRGLTNYWGYNTIGYFAPHQAYRPRSGPGSPAARSTSSRRWWMRCTRRARGTARRRVQPHRRGRSPRPDAVLPGPGQSRVLPPGR
jgi:pullulanase/glycogen debranching enzyme